MNILELFSTEGVAKRKEWWGFFIGYVAINKACEKIYAGDINTFLCVVFLSTLLMTPVTMRRLRDAGGCIWAPFVCLAGVAGQMIGMAMESYEIAQTSTAVGGLVSVYVFFVAAFSKSVLRY